MIEKRVERAFRREALRHDVWAIKGENVPGFPDRICLAWPGRIAFAELKRPGHTPQPLQDRIHTRLRRLGFIVETVDHPDKVESFFEVWLG